MKKVERIVATCATCGQTKEYVPWRLKQLKMTDGVYLCGACSRSNNASKQTFDQRSQRMKKAHADNPEMSSRVGKARRMRRSTPSEIWHAKQLATIKSDPSRYAEYCNKRQAIATAFHASMTDIEKETHYKKVFSGNSRGKSKAEDQFFDVLTENGITCERNLSVSGFFPDGIIGNVIVEFYGDTYHCNPTHFKNPDQYCSWIGRTVQAQWDRDRKRLAVFCSKGIL